MQAPGYLTHTLMGMRDCDFKFVFRAQGTNTTKNEFLTTGIRLHKACEEFLLTGSHRKAAEKLDGAPDHVLYKKVRSYLEEIRPQVEAVELVLKRTDDDGFEMVGRLDILLTNGEAIDFKFTQNPWTEEKCASYSFSQAYPYFWMEPRATRMRYVIIPRRGEIETGWVVPRDEPTLERYLRQWKAILRQIRAMFEFNTFTPTQNPNVCKWCDYNKVCPHAKV